MNTHFLFDKLKFEIHEASYTTVGKEWEKVVSVYPYNRIYLVTDGEAEIQLKDSTIKLEAGYMYFIPAFQLTSSRLIKPLAHYYIHFLTDLSPALDIVNAYALKTKRLDDGVGRTIFDIAMQNRIPQNAKQQLRLDAALRLLFSFFMENEPKLDYFNPAIQKAIEYIDAHIFEDINIADLASEMGYNRSYYYTIFKNAFGCSPKQYVLDQKIKKAQILLLDYNKSIESIARTLNFSSSMYFCRIFKKKTQMTPSEYRKQLQNA